MVFYPSFPTNYINFVSEWEKTLQLIGIVGLGQVLILVSRWKFILISFPNIVWKITNMLNFFFFFIKYVCVRMFLCLLETMPMSMDIRIFFYLLLSEGLVEIFIVYIAISNLSFLVPTQLGWPQGRSFMVHVCLN